MHLPATLYHGVAPTLATPTSCCGPREMHGTYSLLTYSHLLPGTYSWSTYSLEEARWRGADFPFDSDDADSLRKASHERSSSRAYALAASQTAVLRTTSKI